MTNIVNNFHKITEKIHQLDTKGRVELLAVSKTQSLNTILQVHQAGQYHFGENYLQEALVKIKQAQDLPIIWHFIGAIQANKTKDIATYFDWVHSVDRIKIARRLNQQRANHLLPLNICLQVNIDNESTKSGVNIKQLPALIQSVQTLPNIKLRGLMCIPHADNSKPAFIKMQALFKAYTQFDVLSMGMSNDLESAIKHGSTMVRIGTAIFGERQK